MSVTDIEITVVATNGLSEFPEKKYIFAPDTLLRKVLNFYEKDHPQFVRPSNYEYVKFNNQVDYLDGKNATRLQPDQGLSVNNVTTGSYFVIRPTQSEPA